MGKRKSLHIGLNFVDPDQYGGWDGQLAGCINDANDMKQVAESRGFTAETLIDGEATIGAVRDKLNEAAAELDDGDFFFLTYSGHGGQVPDQSGDEQDGYDETWCLYDTELVDDSLYGALCTFNKGVRIFVMSDSCHSETVTRAALVRTREERRAFADKQAGPTSKRAPIEFTSAEFNKNEDRYKEQRTWWPARSRPDDSPAKVVLISGCEDAQTSMDGPGNGAFTYAFKQIWGDGDYQKDYRSLHVDVRETVNNPDQRPCIFHYGQGVDTMLDQIPLSDEDVGSGLGGRT
jgi:metacaspase-1